ncbi:MAG TPA: hypothetical protein VFI62_01500 [Burkholderiales bacterium]|nr:hypothetical protein [Burkholderiales bacterium]
MATHSMNNSDRSGLDAIQMKRLAVWLMLGVLAALLGWFGLRGYLNPELLFLFANALHC